MNRIRELRKQFNLTQSELATICKTSTSNISGWECEKWQPDNENLITLANYFNVTVDYLIGREDFTPEEINAGASATKKISITPIDEQMLELFRQIGLKHGRETQTEILNMLEKMT